MAEQHGTRPPTSTIFIGNIPYDVTEQMLMDIFSEVGPIKSLRMVIDKESGKTKGYGFCEYHDKAIAIQAVQHLNKHEVSGRMLRVDYADEHSADNTDRRPQRKDGHGGGGGGGRGGGGYGPAPPPGTRPIGHHAAAVSSQQMSTMLGGFPTISYSQDRINSTIAGMTPMQLFEIMSQMRQLITQNQSAARAILVANPQLTKALFQAQILLGMVKPPSVQAPAPPPAAAPVGLPQPSQLQPAQFPSAAPHQQFAPAPAQPVYVTAPLQLPPQQQPLPQQPSPMTLVALPGGQILVDPTTGQQYNTSGQPIPMQIQQPAAPQQLLQPQPMPVQLQPQVQQSMQTSLMQPPIQQLPQQQPMQQQPIQQQQQQQQQQPQPPAQQQAAPGMSQENQSALLQAVLTMSQEQIDALPPVQREQVLAVRQQISGMRPAA